MSETFDFLDSHASVILICHFLGNDMIILRSNYNFGMKIEWFGTLIQLTYTSLAVQINKSKSIYYDHSAKTKNHRICRAKLHILR